MDVSLKKIISNIKKAHLPEGYNVTFGHEWTSVHDSFVLPIYPEHKQNDIFVFLNKDIHELVLQRLVA